MLEKSANEPGGGDELPFSQPQLLDLFDVLVAVIFCMKNASGTYLAVNNAFVRRTGRSSKRDVIGHRAEEFFAPQAAERYAEQDARVFSSGEPLRDEIELIRREDGSQGWYLTTKLPVAGPAGDGPTALVSVSRDLKTPSHDSADAAALSRVVEHVRTNLDKTIRTADLAAVSGLTPTQLERRMRNVFGLSPSKYVLRARVDRAAELLSDPDLALADVAVRAGFYDQANLTRQFARFTNETPAQFRSQLRSGSSSATPSGD